jgi:hypothetical protein
METILSAINVKEEVLMAIEWGIIPIILLGMLLKVFLFNPEDKSGPKIKKSYVSGKYAGLVIFALFILSQKENELIFSFKMPTYEFDLFLVLFATAVGTAASLIFDLIKKHTIIGLYTLISVSTLSTGIYCYLFIQHLRHYLIFVTMGMVLGIFIFRIFYPLAVPSKENKEIIRNS